jgi:hypothetical protein
MRCISLGKQRLFRFLGLCFLVWLGLGGLAGFAEEKVEPKDSPQVYKVKVVTDFKPDLSLKGVVMPQEFKCLPQIEMKEFGGDFKIESILPQGTSVKSGDIILKLDTEPLDKEIKNTVERLDNLKFDFAQSKERLPLDEKNSAQDLERAEIRYARAKEQLKNYTEIEWPLQKDRDALSMKWSEGRLADQITELEQLVKMYEESEIASKTKDLVLERTKRDVELSKISLELSKREQAFRHNVEHPKKLEDLVNEGKWAKEDLELLKKRTAMNADKSKESLGNMEFELREQTERLEHLKNDLSLCTLTAGSSGVLVYGDLTKLLVSDRPIFKELDDIPVKGDSVKPDRLAFTVYAPEKYGVMVSVPESVRFLVENGLKGLVLINALPDRSFHAAVSQIADLADGKKGGDAEYSTCLKLEEADLRRLQPGLSCTVKLDFKAFEGVIMIPSKLLIERKGKVFVKVKKDDAVSEQEVFAGMSDNNNTIILYGIATGDELVFP